MWSSRDPTHLLLSLLTQNPSPRDLSEVIPLQICNLYLTFWCNTKRHLHNSWTSPKIACPSLKQPLNLLVLHQLISCQEALAQGWCIWRHDLVLNCLVSKGVTHKLSTCVLTSSRGGSYHNSYYCQLKRSPLRVPLPHVHMQWQGKQLQILIQ